MAVCVHGDLNRMVPELFLYIYEAFIILNQKIGKRMSKVMYPDLPQIRFGQAFEKYPFLLNTFIMRPSSFTKTKSGS
jgi:hypothetical protein